MNSKVLIITGMHRSGTSLITQWLHHCGLSIGDRLVGPDIGNIQGHFEDSDFLEIHQQFLKKRKCSPVGFVDRAFAALTDVEKEQLRKIIERKSCENREWGWKDPRTCLFLDAYKELIPSAFYLIIVRNLQATISSLITRECKVNLRRYQTKRGISKLKWDLFKRKRLEEPFEIFAERFLKIWIYYYERIFIHINTLSVDRYMFVNYERLAQNNRDTFTRLINDWHFSLHYCPFSSIYDKELLSEVQDIDKYIGDKEMLERAKTIERHFNRMLTS